MSSWSGGSPQILGAYLLAGWGLIQFVDFLEERYDPPGNLVDATGLFLVLLVPAVAIFAWTHGPRPPRSSGGSPRRWTTSTPSAARPRAGRAGSSC